MAQRKLNMWAAMLITWVPPKANIKVMEPLATIYLAIKIIVALILIATSKKLAELREVR